MTTQRQEWGRRGAAALAKFRQRRKDDRASLEDELRKKAETKLFWEWLAGRHRAILLFDKQALRSLRRD